MDVTNMDLVAFKNAVVVTPGFQPKLATRNYKFVMLIQPGTIFAGTAFVPQEYVGYSRYRGAAITWQTMCHEIGHNLNLRHAGGMFSPTTYQQYQDDALMGYQRSFRNVDFNAVARYRLGFMEESEVASYPITSLTTIRALNEGHQADGNHLLFIVPCPSCVAAADGTRAYTGSLFISFRVKDEGNTYGVDNSVRIYPVGGTSNILVLEDRVHVHFQKADGGLSEIWNTMDAGESWNVVGTDIVIKVCSISLKSASNPVSTETALVGVGTVAVPPQCVHAPPSPPSAPVLGHYYDFSSYTTPGWSSGGVGTYPFSRGSGSTPSGGTGPVGGPDLATPYFYYAETR